MTGIKVSVNSLKPLKNQNGSFLLNFTIFLLVITCAVALLFGVFSYFLDKRQTQAQGDVDNALGINKQIIEIISQNENNRSQSDDSDLNENSDAKFRALFSQLEPNLKQLYTLAKEPLIPVKYSPDFVPKNAVQLNPIWSNLDASYQQYQKSKPASEAFYQLQQHSLSALAAIREDLTSLASTRPKSQELANKGLLKLHSIEQSLSNTPEQFVQLDNNAAVESLAPLIEEIIASDASENKAQAETLRTLLVLAQRVDRSSAELRDIASETMEAEEHLQQLGNNAETLQQVLNSLRKDFAARPFSPYWYMLEKAIVPTLVVLFALFIIFALINKVRKSKKTVQEPSISRVAAAKRAQNLKDQNKHESEQQEAQVADENTALDLLLKELKASEKLTTLVTEPTSGSSPEANEKVAEIARALNARSTKLASLDTVSEENARHKQALSDAITELRGTLAQLDSTAGEAVTENLGDAQKQALARLKRINEAAMRIGDNINSLQESMNKMNILALNASIQASVAGEAGRGFSTVIDEVQRLVERASGACQQMETMHKVIRSDASQASNSVSALPKPDAVGAEPGSEAQESAVVASVISQCKGILQTLEAAVPDENMTSEK